MKTVALAVPDMMKLPAGSNSMVDGTGTPCKNVIL
jgi:hypothetical protein